MCRIDSLEDYALHIRRDDDEAEALFRDLLIGVTSFFRDPAVFAALEEKVIPALVDGRSADSTLRVWVPGCSTGEEAYSLAILIQERLESQKRFVPVQIFATDIDARSIALARAGVYPASIASDVSEERLVRFFSHGPGGAYRVQKTIRDMIVFSEQDMIKDPPFSRVDLISCRNVLIYMGPELQRKLLPLFHYSICPDGFLLLGTSESVGDLTDLYKSIDRSAKLYRRLDLGYRPPMARVPVVQVDRLAKHKAPLKPVEPTPTDLREITEQTMLLGHGTAAALVNERGDILYLHGRTGNYLEPAPGDASMNVLAMAREGLRRDLTAALRKTVVDNTPVHRPSLKVKTNGDFTLVDLTVSPAMGASDAQAGTRLFVVMLEASRTVPTKDVVSETPGDARGSEAQSGAIDELRQELAAKEEYLQAVLEEMESSNEELKSTNEEMQSVNEELQSTNEELETSKEELQSVNEELATVNAELQNRITELTQSNNDMNNLLAGTGIGTIFVDTDMKIQRFTPTVTRLINLIDTDVGRPVGHLASNLEGYTTLAADTKHVLETLESREAEVRTERGDWYLLRIRPYRTLENVIEGASITFTEITELKRAQAAMQVADAERRLAVVVKDARDAITVRDMNGMLIAWNEGATTLYGWTEDEALTMNAQELVPPNEQKEALEVVRRLSAAEVLEPHRARRVTKDGRAIEVWLTATALAHADGEIYAIATTEREVGSGARRTGR